MTVRRALQVAVLAMGLVVVFITQGQIDRYGEREAALPEQVAGSADMSPTLALITFALGPLRGLIVDALWWRAMERQAREEYFDAWQLADWITQLQPEFDEVWAYQGWNMAFNIAADFAAPAERWRWIDRGLKLLRDRGLQFNPESSVIRHEVARIFYDRIGTRTDQGGEYFGRQWAFRMMEYLDEGTRPELRRLAAAAATREALLANPAVTAYVTAAREQGEPVLDFREAPPTPEGVDVGLPATERAAAAEAVYWHWRRKRLEEDLKLDPERMVWVDEQYGPLDWRLQQAHAIYWIADEDFDRFVRESGPFAYVVRQAMVSSFFEGRLFYDAEKNVITRTANLEIIGRVHDYIEYMMEHQWSRQVEQDHLRFTELATAILYSYNREKEAREMFRHYAELHLDDDPIDFETFVTQSLRRTLRASMDQTQRGVVLAALHQACYWVYLGEYDRANGYSNLARMMWARNQRRFMGQPARLLPPFAELVAAARRQFCEERALEEERFAQRVEEAKAKTPDSVYLGDYHDTEEKLLEKKTLRRQDGDGPAAQ